MASAPAEPKARPSSRWPVWLAPLLALGALVAGPALFAALGTPVGHSVDFNLAWTAAFEAALADGAWYPRHLPALWYDLGGLDFFFYAPLPFFVAALPARLICVDCSLHTVFALAGGLFWALGTVTFYGFARRFVAPPPALVGAAVYAVLPYHLAIDWFVRQSAGEFAAYAFVPLVAGGIVSALRAERWGPSLPLGFAGLLLCHLPTAFLSGHVFAAVVAVWAVARPRAAPTALLRLALSTGLGLALAAAFWLPALVLLPDVSADALRVPHLLAENWLFFDGRPEPDGRLTLVVRIALAGALVAALLACGLAPRGRRGEVALWTLVPVVVAGVLMTAVARPLWQHGVIAAVQFPFRLMVLVDLAAALAGAVLADVAITGRERLRRGVAVAGIVATLAGRGWATAPALRASAEGLARRGEEVRMAGAVEYLPPHFGEPILAALERRRRGPWEAFVVVEERLPALRAAGGAGVRLTVAPRRWTLERAEPARDGADLTLAIPYWRHLRAVTADGRAVALAPAPGTGLVRLEPPAGARDVEITLPLHWSEQVGLALSGLGVAGLVLLTVRARRGA